MNRDVATILTYNNSTKKQSTRREMKDIYSKKIKSATFQSERKIDDVLKKSKIVFLFLSSGN